MAIQLNTFYNQKQLSLAMGINERTFKRNKTEIMEYLNEYYLFQSWNDSVSQMFIFHQQFEDTVPQFTHKRKAQSNSKADNMKYYADIIDKEIEINPIFTAYGLASNLHLIAQLPTEHTIRTARRYLKEVLSQNIYACENVWAKQVWNKERYINEWVELTPEEQKKYFDFISSMRALNPKIFALENDWRNGLISYEDYAAQSVCLNSEFWDDVEKGWKDLGNPKISRKPKWVKGAF